MKKLSLFLAVVMILSAVVAVPVFAVAPTADVEATSSAVILGGKAYVDIVVSNATGTSQSMQINYTYDTDVFTLDTENSQWLITTAIDQVKANCANCALSAISDVDGAVLRLAFDVNEEAELGEYTIAMTSQIKIGDTTDEFNTTNTSATITVAEKALTAVDIAIDTGLSIGVHFIATEAALDAGVGLIALDESANEYVVISEYEEGDGDYIFKLDVAPYAMDKIFTVDFSDNFVIDAGDLDTAQIPETAKQVGILKYCEDAQEDASGELMTLMADMLAYGQLAATYAGAEGFDMPDGFEAVVTNTTDMWFADLGDGEVPCTFAEYAVNALGEAAPAQGTNNTAKKKFKFTSVDVEIGSQFVATFTLANNGTSTAASGGRVKANGGDAFGIESDMTFKYAFAATEYAGVDFVVYGSTSSFTNSTKSCSVNYGIGNFAAYAANNDASEDLMNLLEAFYVYGQSAEAYLGSLE